MNEDRVREINQALASLIGDEVVGEFLNHIKSNSNSNSNTPSFWDEVSRESKKELEKLSGLIQLDDDGQLAMYIYPSNGSLDTAAEAKFDLKSQLNNIIAEKDKEYFIALEDLLEKSLANLRSTHYIE